MYGNSNSNLRLWVDEPLCQKELKELLQKVEKNYHELTEACHIAHQLKNGDIPDDPSDERMLRSKKLRQYLVSVAHLLGRAPSVAPFN